MNELLEKAEFLKKLDDELQAWLPPTYQHKIRVINLRKGVLVLEGDHASIISKARYLQSDLVNYLRMNLIPQLVSVEWKVKI